ncbi:MAG: hypothetical protein AAF705_21145, partial [Bacteroidota bacterium]
ISTDRGQSWVQFKNGYPSVSTMDLKIQERESSLIIGTYGRAIWVLDDLQALRAVAGRKLKRGLTALPVNDAVQVKGLFIAPPGNIWTGFHTTFEGKNRVFQKVEIPYYIDDPDFLSSTFIAQVYDQDNRLINTIQHQPKITGLNYLIWKLDEQTTTLPGAWITEESRGTPVLPGDYKIVINGAGLIDSTQVKVVADPRFDLKPEVDQQLYQYQRGVDEQVENLTRSLLKIDEQQEDLNRIEKRLSEIKSTDGDHAVLAIRNMRGKLTHLRSKGRTQRPSRQVGAWQTSIVTPYSKIRDVQSIAMSRTRPISQQEKDLLTEATQMVQEFQVSVEQFMKEDWKNFVQHMKTLKIDWLSDLE